MTLVYSIAARQAKANADLASIGMDASLEIFGGTRPASPDVAPGSTALATFSMGTGVAFGTATSGVITAATIPSATIANNGTATWARLLTSGGVGVIDYDVSTTSAGTGDIQFATTTFVAGVVVSISSFTITEN